MARVLSSVLIVGAGPTGLTLALQLARAGVAFRIVDAAATSVHESRALAMQARTLEVLEPDGVAAELVELGDPAREIVLHARRDVVVPLFEEMNDETNYPYILFVSQAETERVLLAHLERFGVSVERDARLISVRPGTDDVEADIDREGQAETARFSYVVGCDGAHSAVRTAAGIDFAGSGYPQSFGIADLEVDGLAPGPVHAFIAEAGIMFFFPLGSPASWRLLALLPDSAEGHTPSLSELQSMVDTYAADSGAALRLHDPVWVTEFRIHSRWAARFRQGRVLLAGDAAHIHSPAGAQGMNTGIQDAVNLGWKLAQVVEGVAPSRLLDSYQDERLPVARRVLSMTDRLFRIAVSRSVLIRRVRPRLAPAVLRVVARSRAARRLGFRTISEIDIAYRRSPLTARTQQIRWTGLRSGDRLPDLRVNADGTVLNLRLEPDAAVYLLVALNGAEGEPASPSNGPVRVLRATSTEPGSASAWMLIRPDGYVAGIWRHLAPAERFLSTLLTTTLAS